LNPNHQIAMLVAIFEILTNSQVQTCRKNDRYVRCTWHIALPCSAQRPPFQQMIKDLKNSLRQSVTYGMGNVLVKATGLALMPIYLSTLDTDEYGALVIFEVLTQFMVGVFSFRLQSSLLRFGSELPEGRAQGKVYFTSVVSMMFIAAAVFVLFLPTRGLMSQFLFDSDNYRHYFPVLFGSIAFEMLALMPMQLFRLQEKPLAFTGFLALKLACMLGFVSYFVMVKDMGVYGAILGIFWANLVMLLATVPAQIKYSYPVFEKKVAWEMFRFGAPLIFTSISAILLSIGDRVIIKIFGELSDVGVYTLAYKVGSVVNLLVINSFTMGFLPIAFKKFKEPGFARFFSKMLTYFTVVTVVFTLIISLFSKELIKILSADTPDFWIAVILVPFIAFSFVFKAIQFFISLTFHFTKHTRYDALVTVVGFVVNIALNFTLIPFYGIYGAVAATAISYIGMGWLTQHYAQRLFPVNFEIRKILVLILSCAIFIAAGIAINDLNIWLRLCGKTVLALGYVYFIYAALAGREEKEKIGKVIWLLRQKDGLKAVLQDLRK
jgi:O-antigen/teichoic acid export membrane protein